MDQVRLSTIAASLTYLASKSRFMTVLQAIHQSELQSDPEYVMHISQFYELISTGMLYLLQYFSVKPMAG